MSKKNNHNEELVSLIFSTSRLIHDRIHKNCNMACQLSALQRETLRFIQEKGNPLMKELADYLCITRPSTTSLIDHLVAEKLVKRVVDPKDRRSVRLTITPKVEEIIAQSKAKIFECLSALSDNDIKNLNQILNKLSTSINFNKKVYEKN